ncbi:hypothetical protein Tco_0938488 [Tanacetum coccineum]|uniref:Uncharacterized protein n=1 Tax=Tanacetum coccineum TaxID=301880 RepID=A0ABQ5DK11_9ASTR
MFIKYFTSQILPKKSRGKGLQGKKTADTTKATVDVSEESDREPAIKRTASKRVVKKKVTIIADDKIVHELDVALEIVTEPVSKPARRRPTESKKTSRRQPGTCGSSEGTGVSPGVPDESIIIPATSSEGTESEYSKEENDDETIEWVNTNKEKENKDEDDDKSIDLEHTNNEETDDEFVHGEEHVQDDNEEMDDEFVHGDEQVNDDEDKEMTNAEVEESQNGDEEITDAAKVDAGKTEEDTTNAEINSLLDIKIQSEVPHIQSVFVLTVPALDASKLKKIDHSAKVLATFKSQVPTVVEHYLGSKIGDDLQNILQRHTADLILKYFVKASPEPSKIQTLTIDLEPKSEKSASEIRKIKKEQAGKQKMSKYTIKSTDKASLKKYD